MADDIGVAHGINQGTFAAYRDGIVRSTNVIVPGAWLPEAVKLAAEHPQLDIGIHLTLTSEWEGVRWRPLTYGKTLIDDDGYFLPMVWPKITLPKGSSLVERRPDLCEAERELRAQIELAKRRIPRVSYLWGHMSFFNHSNDFRRLGERLADEYGLVLFESVVDSGLIKPLGAGYNGTDAGDIKAQKLAQRLESLEPGTWLMVDHCATDTPELQAIGHEGYRHVAADRSGVVTMWTDPRVKAVIARRGIALIAVPDLLPEYRAWRAKQVGSKASLQGN